MELLGKRQTDSHLIESSNAPYFLVSMAETKYEAFKVVIHLTRNSFQLLILFVTKVLLTSTVFDCVWS